MAEAEWQHECHRERAAEQIRRPGDIGRAQWLCEAMGPQRGQRSEDQAISGVLSGSVKLWDLNEGKAPQPPPPPPTPAVHTLTGHRGSALSLDFHPFEPFFALGSQDSTARVWDPRQQEAVHMLMPSTCFSSPAHRPPTTSPLPLPPSPTHPHQPCAR
ncbi:unnamed protein product [Closterium sp. NIES-53]